ncbi:peptidylprolyl isomerase [Polaribacter reichenbachii]|uniref:Peptidyl-prolyl cis-trans isomerase n=1 Tax=Polaribacter reichenbachii TaxID=996801 RepID=A0A1B8TPN0_9FLAO|nr:peptidylprolyl isomerase [Polaribacter reichenbachii]APZ46909.1 peptidylprolyl isomerase [Polaribacter reichenbachii]AUC17552.1 peptidylprolyl isomerase [Polaribacter reichenbachii]OBY61575.1 peptidylprolyl isomerase [Polaribacter reichenbachii]
MKLLYRLFILTLLISFYQCDAKKESKKEKTILNKTIKQKEEEKIIKPWDSLNSTNTEAFLLEYGKQNPETKVIIKTKFGNIKLRLYEDVPVHRANFIFLTKIKYFNTTVIYRVAKNFVIQGGNSDNMYTQKQRRKYGNYLMKPEFRNHRKHKYGALAAARQWENNPNKLSSPFEFYMVHKRSGAHHLDNEHTVFGEVISGFDTMDKISKVKVGVDEWPINDIQMTIEILE